jgi:hypothetical protein
MIVIGFPSAGHVVTPEAEECHLLEVADSLSRRCPTIAIAMEKARERREAPSKTTPPLSFQTQNRGVEQNRFRGKALGRLVGYGKRGGGIKGVAPPFLAGRHAPGRRPGSAP